MLLLEREDVEDALLGAAVELAKAYFGAQFDGDFDLENLTERASTASSIGQQIEGHPPWYECKTEPPLHEEVELSLVSMPAPGGMPLLALVGLRMLQRWCRHE